MVGIEVLLVVEVEVVSDLLVGVGANSLAPCHGGQILFVALPIDTFHYFLHVFIVRIIFCFSRHVLGPWRLEVVLLLLVEPELLVLAGVRVVAHELLD